MEAQMGRASLSEARCEALQHDRPHKRPETPNLSISDLVHANYVEGRGIVDSKDENHKRIF